MPMRVATLVGFMVTSKQLTVFRLEISGSGATERPRAF
jgi:hypothetical protein